MAEPGGEAPMSPTGEYKDDEFDFDNVMQNMGESEAHLIDHVSEENKRDVFDIVNEEVEGTEHDEYDENFELASPSMHESTYEADSFEAASPTLNSPVGGKELHPLSNTAPGLAQDAISKEESVAEEPTTEAVETGAIGSPVYSEFQDESVAEHEETACQESDAPSTVDGATGGTFSAEAGEENIERNGENASSEIHEARAAGSNEGSITNVHLVQTEESVAEVEEKGNEVAEEESIAVDVEDEGNEVGEEESVAIDAEIDEEGDEIADEESVAIDAEVEDEESEIADEGREIDANESIIEDDKGDGSINFENEEPGATSHVNTSVERGATNNQLPVSSSDNSAMSQKIETLEHQIEQLTEEKESAVRGKSSAENKCVQMRHRIEELENNLAAKEQSYNELKSQLNSNSDSDMISSLQDSLDEKVKKMIEQAEQNLKLADALHKAKLELQVEKDNVSSLRCYLISEIAGGDEDAGKYSHISLEQLIRTKLQVLEYKDPLRVRSILREAKLLDEGSEGQGEKRASRTSSIAKGSITSALETEISMLKSTVKQLNSRVQEAETVREAAAGSIASSEQLKQRNTELSKRLWKEKENRKQVESELRKSGKRVKALSDHIEKLMVHLKHEAAAKVKASEASRRAEKEFTGLRERNALLMRKAKQREKLLAELREGSKLLEDQLRLMDDKYVELRTKLDWTRTTSTRELSKVKNEASKLRAKFALAVGDNPDLYHEIERLTKGEKGSSNNRRKSQTRSKHARPTSSGLGQPTSILQSSTVVRPMTTSNDGGGFLNEEKQGKKGQTLPTIEQLGAEFNEDELYVPQ